MLARLSIIFSLFLSVHAHSAEVAAYPDPGSWRAVFDQQETIESQIDFSVENASLEADRQIQTVYLRAVDRLGLDLARLDPNELEALFNATWMAGNRVPMTGPVVATELDYHQVLTEVFSELKARGVTTAEQARSLQHSAIANRRFDQARNLANAFPDSGLETIPTTRVPDNDEVQWPRVWRFDSESEELVQRGIDPEGLDWIIQASPGCGFARAAMQAFRSDPELSPLLNARLIWLLPPGWTLDLESQRSWNEAHPDSPMLLMHDGEEWPFLADLALSPQFVRLRDGQVVETIVGWPLGNSHKPLLLALAEGEDQPDT